MDQRNSSRRRKGVHDGRWNWSLFATFQERTSQKNRLNYELMWCLVMFPAIFMANTFPKLKKSSSWMISSVSKEEVICVRVQWHEIVRNKYYGAITKRMNFNCPVVATSENIEPNDIALELNAIAYTFSNIFQPELKVAQNSFQHFLRRWFWWVIITTLYQCYNHCLISNREGLGTSL